MGSVNLLPISQDLLSQAFNGGLVFKQLLGLPLHPVRVRLVLYCGHERMKECMNKQELINFDVITLLLVSARTLGTQNMACGYRL